VNGEVYRIENPETIALLQATEFRTCLTHLMAREWTAATLAKQMEIGLGSLHYRLQKLHKHGLVQVTREEKRSGRSIKHYSAVAKSFFLPYSITDFVTQQAFWAAVLQPRFEGFLEHLVQNLERHDADPNQTGLLVQHIDGVGLNVQNLPRQPQKVQGMVSWLEEEELRLSHEQAQNFKLELKSLLKKYQAQTGLQPYLVQMGLVWMQS
jgi:hypothetical protein